MHIITLTSDWNHDDYYVASLKGKLISRCPDVRIVDISHQVETFKSAAAAFMVRNSFHNFPNGTIHIIGVNTEPEKKKRLLAASVDGHYFICADNGILGMLGAEPDQVVEIPEKPEHQSATFISLSLFADTACSLAEGSPIEKLGVRAKEYDIPAPLKPTLGENTITGSVLYIDSYENAITNISKEFFERTGKGKPFTIFVQSKHNMLEKINNRYNETPDGELLAIFNSLGLLEIAIRNGNAAGLLNLTTDSTIRVDFKEEANAQ
ncbi:MAG: SAM-dependent chlorinase/fluorinase [Bacteroidetes bacterium]|nr:SAM-dependent chlorinase/fluorinase [Bacteroidota bacterium]